MQANILWWLPGAALLLFGILIALFPELLALLVASAFIFAGMSWLAAGWSANRLRQRMSAQRREYHWYL